VNVHLVINASEVGRRRGGNETFIAGVVSGLATLQPTHPWFASSQVSLLTSDWGRPVDLPQTFPQVNLGPYRRLSFFVWQQTQALRRLGADWYLSNFFFPPILPCKGFVAVHDVSFMAHPEYFPPVVAAYMRLLTGRAVRQAARILTISEFSRRELLRFFPDSAENVRVIPLAAERHFVPVADEMMADEDRQRLAQYGIEGSYILALGNIHPRKNLARLLQAYRLLREEVAHPPVLVWSGLQRWESSDLVRRAREVGVVLTGFVADEHLPSLYRQAKMLVYPSLYEGFGLPVLEAMRCGTPVVASSISSIPEVAGEAALLVDPTDVSAMAAAMKRLLTESGLSEELRQAGFIQAAKFSWPRTASLLLQALD
jgi:glycosyltransferase involved in cell wall biosynthesis